MQWWYRQFFNIGKYITMNSMNLFGKDIINKNLPQYAREYTHDQMYRFNMSLPQVEKHSSFNLNWRLTADPIVHNHLMDWEFYFDIGPGMNHCLMKHDEHNYYFQDYDERYI